MKLSEVTNPQSGGRMRLSEVQASIDGKPVKATIEKKPPLTKAFMFGGVPGVGMTPGSEDLLPAVGQTMGGSVGGYPGSIFGASAGQFARQGVRAVRGQGFKLGEIPAEAARTATVEGIFRGGGKVLNKAIKPLTNRLMTSVFKPNLKAITRRPNIGFEAVEEGLVGSKRGILKKAENLISKSEDELQSLLNKSKNEVDTLKIAEKLDDLKRGYSNIGDDAAVKAIDDVQMGLLKGDSGKIPVSQANQLKRDLYNALKSSQFGTSEVPAKVAARKAAAGELKSAIEEAVPEGSVKELNRKIGLGVDVKKAIENRIANEQKGQIIGKIGGMGFGGAMFTGRPDIATGILLGEKAVEGLRSAPVMTGTARNLLAMRKYGRPITLGTTEIIRRFGQS